MMVRASMVVEDGKKYLMTEERENKVTEITAEKGHEQAGTTRLGTRRGNKLTRRECSG